MISIRVVRIVSVAAAASLTLAAIAPAADAPKPVAKVTASISPKKVGKPHKGIGVPVKLKVVTTFTTDTPGADPFVIQKAVVSFPKGAVANGRLFPSCSAKQLNRVHGVLSKCPKGSKIGGGTTTARAIALGITATAKVTLFNGPHGKSVTFNIDVTNPAQINESFDAPLVKTKGKYGYTLTLKVPNDLQTILNSPIAVTRFAVTTGGTTIQKIHGRKVKRGYIEAMACPKGGKAPLHVDVFFQNNVTTAADAQIPCN
jgi:hypothetical protein